MKKAFTFLAAAAFMALNTMAATADYQLVFSDEFNGTSLNTEVWNVEINGDGGGNGELQYYAPGNVTVANGMLNITAKRQSYLGKQFTSGRINTMGKAAFKHGKIEASIKLPSTANGLWPAFWLMGNDLSEGISWPYCGEIDVMEAGGRTGINNGVQDRYFAGALHWGPYTNGNHPMYAQDYTASYSVQDGEFHLYTLIWDDQKISMYLDLDKYPNAQPYFEMNINDFSQSNSPGNYFHKRFFLLLNMAVGGSVPGINNANDVTALNSGDKVMQVDYIRVYQRQGEENYITPDGSMGDDTPEIEPDETTELGRYGSLSLDGNNNSTFDFENSYDYVVIGASNGVIEQMGDKIYANYSVDDVTHFLYIWEQTYNTVATTGLNSFGLNEGWNSYTVGNAGWSGLGYASVTPGKNLSMIDSTYILHFAMRATDPLMHTGHGIYVGNVGFSIGAEDFHDGNKILPVFGDFKRDGRWCSFDIPVNVLLSLNSNLFTNPDNYVDNVFAVLSGGTSGAQLQFDNVFFYKNDNVDTSVPTDDNTTVIGQYASRSLDGAGHSTFDFDDAYDYVIIGASSGVMEQMGDNIVADYSVDNVTNHLYIWEGTYTPVATSGVNSFGLNEGWSSFVVNGAGWSGLGYASTAPGKDLSMLDDSYYLHFAMRGTDNILHTSHTIWVDAAQFVIGNTTSGPVMLGDFRRDGDWYSFDIPFSVLKSLGGDLFTADGGVENFRGNVFAVLSGGAQGAELQFDNVFFYKKHSDTDQPEIDPVLGQYGSKALDANNKPTFDINANGDYVLIYLGEQEAAQMNGKIRADYRVDDVNNFLWVWSGTYAANSTDSLMNSFGYNEGYTSLNVTNQGWSGLGFASQNQGKDLTMLDDTYYLHFAMKATDDSLHSTHAIGVGNAHFAIGSGPYNDNGTIYGKLGDFYRDGNWYNFDIPYSEIELRANPVFDTPDNYLGNVISFLSGGVPGTELNFDAIFFYRKGEVAPTIQGDVNGDGEVDVRDITALIDVIMNSISDNPRADVNGDGDIDVRDITALIDIIMNS
ncbi:MAG: family 16 glycosylhydrolase [Muribaculaceae bacterium]|nr:family 16 glycosylhydrolase [Muribaculaceae bacterium]